MNNYPHPIIAREGWSFLGIAVGVALFIALSSTVWSIPFWIFAIFAFQFYRDPARTVPRKANVVLLPADGRIVVVEKAQDPYAVRDALKVGIFMSVFNVHSNRAPADGKVHAIQYFPCKFASTDRDKASVENERNALVITTSSGQTITCVHVAGLIARRILCYVKAGEALVRGQRYGFIRFGSRVDVYLPLMAIPKVTAGDKVFATETILAE